MSRRFLVFVLAVLLGVMLCTACSSQKNDTIAHTFESPFSVTVTVNNTHSEYIAQITMSALPETVTGDSTSTSPREGSVQYISPDSISDIFARRNGTTVVVGVGGIEITPSPEIAEKYVRLLDLLDIRSEQLQSVSKIQRDGRTMSEAVFSHDGGDVTVTFDAESNMPISAVCGDIQMQFSEFVYL